mgnify:CR=1 FL=1
MTPIAQAVGEKPLILLELAPRRGINLSPKEKVYIGPEKRDKIYYIAGRLSKEKMTETAKVQLQEYVEKMVVEQEKKFVDFFNKASKASRYTSSRRAENPIVSSKPMHSKASNKGVWANSRKPLCSSFAISSKNFFPFTSSWLNHFLTRVLTCESSKSAISTSVKSSNKGIIQPS